MLLLLELAADAAAETIRSAARRVLKRLEPKANLSTRELEPDDEDAYALPGPVLSPAAEAMLAEGNAARPAKEPEPPPPPLAGSLAARRAAGRSP